MSFLARNVSTDPTSGAREGGSGPLSRVGLFLFAETLRA
jgi:hypothetical protein